VRRLALAAAACTLALAASGCGIGPGKRLPGGGAALEVTRDFGQVRLYSTREAHVRDGQTVMRFLASKRKITTRFGGGFVQSIDGLSGSSSSGRHDWFYFVNGIEASVGAAQRTLSPGDVVQWDYRRWDAAMRVPAIVGAYPEPFLRGSGGKRLPVRVECEQPGGDACRTVSSRLGAAGVPSSSALLGGSAGGKTLRVVVGRWSALRSLHGAVAGLAQGPRASGVFARFDSGGRRLHLLNDGGRVARAAPSGTGLVAATATENESPVWVITGLDEAGVSAAARALDPRTLHDAFAVAVTPGGTLRLPLVEGPAR
jgi:hypothetical protein